MSSSLGLLYCKLSFCVLFLTAHSLCCPVTDESAGMPTLRRSLSNAHIFGPLSLEPRMVVHGCATSQVSPSLLYTSCVYHMTTTAVDSGRTIPPSRNSQCTSALFGINHQQVNIGKRNLLANNVNMVVFGIAVSGGVMCVVGVSIKP